MTKRAIERRLDDLEPDTGDSTEIVIRSVLVDENGDQVGVFSEMQVWQDQAGEWQSEKTDYNLKNPNNE